jgi:hypothetical protein
MALDGLDDLAELAPRRPISRRDGGTWQAISRALRPLAGQLRSALTAMNEEAPNTVVGALADAGRLHALCVCTGH